MATAKIAPAPIWVKGMQDIEIRNRFQKAWDSRSTEITKMSLYDRWMYAYEIHMTQGEDWDAAYRFPEIFGSVQRKRDTMTEMLPETRVKDDDDGGISLQASLEDVKKKGNYKAAMFEVGDDTVKHGMGILYAVPVRFTRDIKGKKDPVLFYDGMGFERIDPRDFFPAHSAVRMHDHTGMSYCPYVFRRRIFFYDTFINKYSGSEFKNIDKIRPVTWGSSGYVDQKIPTQRESKEKEFGDFVDILEYWDQENDIFKVMANGIVIYDSPEGIPFHHKKIPFHVYYNYKKNDSMSGLSEIELILPYNLFRETITNLEIDNAKLELQTAYIIDGDIDFNPEENELQPGGIFNVGGLEGGKLQDHIMPYRVGGLTGDIASLVERVEDSQIVVTGDDRRALVANPNQLATQTKAKQYQLEKRSLSTLMKNTAQAEYYLSLQLASYIQNELSEQYEDEDGLKTYREIEIDGYNVVQDKKESGLQLIKGDRQKGKFRLNPEVAKQMKGKGIEIVDAISAEELSHDKLQSQQMLIQTVASLIQIAPENKTAQELLQGMDAIEFFKETAEQLKLNVDKMFPVVAKRQDEYDTINNEHEAIMTGENPPIEKDEDSQEHYDKHTEFRDSAVFKEAKKAAQDAMKDHLKDTMLNIVKQAQDVQETDQTTVQPDSAGVASAAQFGNQTSVQGVPQIAGRQAQTGGVPVSPQAVA